MLRSRDTKTDSLATIDVLAGLSARDLRAVSALTTEIRLPAEKVLCREGDIGREAFFLVSGMVAATQDGAPLGVVRSGGILGEMAVLGHQPRTATLTALTDVTVLALSRGELLSLVASYPGVAEAIRSLMDLRVQENELVSVG